MTEETKERDWAYELWVHLSDHVQQKWTAEEPDDCEHCKSAEVDCDDCRKLLVEWEQSLGDEGESVSLPTPTHQVLRARINAQSRREVALEATLRNIYYQAHPLGRQSSCAGPPHCSGCNALEALKTAKTPTPTPDPRRSRND